MQKMVLEIEGGPVRGEFLRIGTTVDSRHRRKLGGHANVKGVSGTWKDPADNVNGLAASLTEQLQSGSPGCHVPTDT